MKCPKCSYERKSTDEAPDWQCPLCGVVYAKVLRAQQDKATLTAAIEPDAGQTEQEAEEAELIFQERLVLASQGQKMVIHSFLLNMVLGAVERAHILSGLVLEALFICIAVYALTGVVRICSGLDKTQNEKLSYMVMSFFPLVNLVLFVYLSFKTSGVLREAGWTVGLLGARP